VPPHIAPRPGRAIIELRDVPLPLDQALVAPGLGPYRFRILLADRETTAELPPVPIPVGQVGWPAVPATAHRVEVNPGRYKLRVEVVPRAMPRVATRPGTTPPAPLVVAEQSLEIKPDSVTVLRFVPDRSDPSHSRIALVGLDLSFGRAELPAPGTVGAGKLRLPAPLALAGTAVLGAGLGAGAAWWILKKPGKPGGG
jgi:hypothetical protein